MKLVGSCHCKAVSFELESATPYPFLRCYCSICRKTAGGGGYAINLMGEANTLKVKGREFVNVYHAIMSRDVSGNPEKISEGQRHFCKNCASCLWIFSPQWPELVHPFASAIDTNLPIPPEHVHVCLDFAANWCEVLQGKNEHHFGHFNDESIEEWHKARNLFKN